MTNQANKIWNRAREGQSSVVIGLPPTLLIPEDFKVLRINCAFPWTTKGPLHKAFQQIQEWLGEVENTRHVSLKGGDLRYQLLGEMPLRLVERGFAAACNRLGKATGGKTILLFEAAEHADQGVVDSLEHFLSSPDTLSVPWILGFHHKPGIKFDDLLDKLMQNYGEEIFLEAGSYTSEGSESFDWSTLPQSVLRIVRAGAVIGSVFEAELVAQLLDLSHMDVLEGLQAAADSGASLGDYGNSRFFLPPDSVTELNQQTLPSLFAHWHESLTQMLMGQHSREEDVEPKEELESANSIESHDPLESNGSIKSNDPIESIPSQRNPYVGFFTEDETEELEDNVLDPSEAPEPPEEPLFESSVFTLPPEPSPLVAEPHKPYQDHFRAAAHLRAAGKSKESLLNYLAAANDASAAGDTRMGMYAAQQAIELLANLPHSTQRSTLEARILIATARLKWHGAVAGNAFTLQEALETVEAAKEALPSTASLELSGQLVALYAGIANDLGSISLLNGAVQELTSISRRLLEADKPLQAARLLNDQAALYIRLGDPLQASHLLFRSRELFKSILVNDPEDAFAKEELADTEHLLARLPLHARVRENHEYDAYSLALQHTERADALYQELGLLREQARVWTTQGKLELHRDNISTAERYLLSAIQTQNQLGDFTGLARSSAALADLFMSRGRYSQALLLVGESTVLNLEKGAPLGIAFNRRAFQTLVKNIASHETMPSQQLQKQIHQLEQLLHHAESLLGRINLPEDSRDGLLHAKVS